MRSPPPRPPVRSKKSALSVRDIASLLYPAASFLVAGGISPRDASQAFAAQLKLAQSRRALRPLEHIGQPTPYVDLVSRWCRDSRYVGPEGGPRPLPLGGLNSFAGLVKEISPAADPARILAVLRRYKTVVVRAGKVALVHPFFSASSDAHLAFEPVAYFLSDAASTLTGILNRRRNSKRAKGFWRKVDTVTVSDALVEEFLAYASGRSLIYLEELDDWLQAHARARRSGRGKKRRIGLGLFSICSELEGSAAKR